MYKTSIRKKINCNEEAVIIAFRNKPKTESKDMKRFCNRVYGYKDHSQKGKYVYERKGLLDEIPNILINPIRSLIIVKKNDAEKVLEFLKEFDTEVFFKEIKLQKEDLEKLENHKP